jgi:tmRNA-binding protein
VGFFFFVPLLSLVALFVDKAVEIGISGRKRTFDKRSKKKDDGVKEEIERSRG